MESELCLVLRWTLCLNLQGSTVGVMGSVGHVSTAGSGSEISAGSYADIVHLTIKPTWMADHQQGTLEVMELEPQQCLVPWWCSSGHQAGVME